VSSSPIKTLAASALVLAGGALTLLFVSTIGWGSSTASPSDSRAATHQISRRDAIVEAVEEVGPAVVNISTEIRVRNPYYESTDVFDWFFGRGQRRPREYFVENSLGSGVIVDPTGYVLTNDHVIAAASRITVSFQDGRQVAAEVVGSDRASDLAVLQLAETGPWPAVAMGDSSDLMIGETVIAIGNPFGLQNTVTVGVVSAIGRTLPSGERGGMPYADFLQTDAAINPGNSGGALLNVEGELIGINTMISAQGQNLGFAIPVDRARKVFDELVTYRRVRPAWTGLAVEDLDAEQARALGLESASGVLVWKRHGKSPAEEAGIAAGDVILEIDGRKVSTIAEYNTAIDAVPYGETVPIRIWRRGSESRRALRVAPFPDDRADEFLWKLLGVTLTEGPGAVYFDDVDARSYLGQRELPRGWRLVQLNGRKVSSLDDVRAQVPDLLDRRSVHMMVASSRKVYRVTVPLT